MIPVSRLEFLPLGSTAPPVHLVHTAPSQSLSEFFDMRKMPSRVLTIVFVVCLVGVFVADVIGLKYLYSDAATLQCDAIVTENGAINLWTSLATVTLFVLAFLHHVLCSR
jgi:hypothetical protein